MKHELLIREIFRLADGNTVLACEAESSNESLIGRKALLVAETGDIRQEINLMGERSMLNQTARPGLRALETQDAINLTSTEAQSGQWRLICEV